MDFESIRSTCSIDWIVYAHDVQRIKGIRSLSSSESAFNPNYKTKIIWKKEQTEIKYLPRKHF